MDAEPSSIESPARRFVSSLLAPTTAAMYGVACSPSFVVPRVGTGSSYPCEIEISSDQTEFVAISPQVVDGKLFVLSVRREPAGPAIAARIDRMGTRNRRRKTRTLGTPRVRGASRGEAIDAVATAKALANFALNRLTPEERLICLWKRLGYSSSEIASAQAQSTSAIDALFRAAMAKLRR